MSQQLFKALAEGHDSINRIVFICKDAGGFFIYKPGSGFRSKHYADDEQGDQDKEVCFQRQLSCGHTHAFYEKHELPAADEVFDMDVVKKELKKPSAKKAAAPVVIPPADDKKADAPPPPVDDAVKELAKAATLAEKKAAKAATKKAAAKK